MRINYQAADANLMAVNDGAVATIRVNGSDEIVGVVTNQTSADGYTVSTWGIDAQGHAMPVIVMTKDSPCFAFEVLNASIKDFTDSKNCAEFYDFTRQLCEHHGWIFEPYAGLHCAYWLTKNFSRITDDNIVQAAEVVKRARIQFYEYVKMARIGPA